MLCVTIFYRIAGEPNYPGAKLQAKKFASLNGKCYLNNKGVVLSEDKLNLQVSSATNEGLLSAKSLIRIDNNSNYFKNVEGGIILTEGILQVAATGPWWINAGIIITKKIQSDSVLLILAQEI